MSTGDRSRDEGRAAGNASGPDALIVFLATATVGLLALLVAARFQPAWFGLAPAAPETDPDRTSFAARPAQPRGAGSELLPRPVVPRTVTEPSHVEALFSDALPSVVHVTIRSSTDVVIVTEEFIAGTGSGLVWDDQGHIVTCLHVVADATSAFVTLADGSEWEAKLVGLDDSSDLAVVRIDAPRERLTPIRVGTSSDLKVGASVFSVACPYGLGHSLSVGYVSGLDRRIRSSSNRFLDGTIQTDASLHPGSSGGALIDDEGRVVGLNAAIHADSRKQVGVGFAIPIDRLQEVVPAIIENGFRWTPRFGFVVVSDANSAALLDKLAQRGDAPGSGVIVAEITEDGPAAAAGLRSMLQRISTTGEEQLVVQDVIVAAGGRPVVGRADLEVALAALEPGQPLELTVARPGREVVELVLTPGVD